MVTKLNLSEYGLELCLGLMNYHALNAHEDRPFFESAYNMI